jgi:hypothetical protein
MPWKIDSGNDLIFKAFAKIKNLSEVETMTLFDCHMPLISDEGLGQREMFRFM